MITAYGNIEDAKFAIKTGAYDYLTKPVKEKELVLHINNALKKDNFNKLSYQLIGKSEPIKKIKQLIKDISDTDVSVLISGKTGTGKEVVAKLIHSTSNRKDNELITINCSAIPENLMESELFGFKKGSFTGANKDKKGKFLLADNGTIFLDEITEMSYNLQSKLLRVLQEQEIDPIGNEKNIKINVRVISATNKDIKQEIKNNKFREDLYYRLNVFPINLPLLKDRKEDIPLLINHFNKKLIISNNVMNIFMNYNWPGNIRELENIIKYLTIIVKDNIVTPEHLPEKIKYNNKVTSNGEKNIINENQTLPEIEKSKIIEILQKNKYNKSKTARDLDITRSVLLYKLQKYNIN